MNFSSNIKERDPFSDFGDFLPFWQFGHRLALKHRAWIQFDFLPFSHWHLERF